MNKNNQLISLIEKTDLNLNLKKITFDELKNGRVNNSFLINDIENNRKYVLVTEGPFDALAIDGVAIGGSNINYQHCLLYTSDAADE